MIIIDEGMSMEIATLSFGIEKKELEITSLSQECRITLIEDIIDKHQPDLLCTAGYSLDDMQGLNDLTKKIKELKKSTTVLVEVKKSSTMPDCDCLKDIMKRKKRQFTKSNSAKLYVIYPNGQEKCLGNQHISHAENARPKECFLENLKKDRVLEVNKKKILLLNCGEINILKTQRNGNKSSCYRYPEYKQIMSKIPPHYIINPTHTLMKMRPSLLESKRKFISQSSVYISISNWSGDERQGFNHEIHTVLKNRVLQTPKYINSLNQNEYELQIYKNI